MTSTHFENTNGLDDTTKNHVTSARDIALMSRELLKYDKILEYTRIWTDSVRDGAFGLTNTNKLIRYYKGANGLKTGFTANAGYCLSATAQRDGLGLIAVVMGCATSQERFGACKQLLDYGFANFALVAPQLPGENRVPVKLGTADWVKAIPGEDVQLLIDKSQRDSVTTQIELDSEISAPVSRGQKLGTMTVRAGQQVLTQIPMVAEEGVARLTWGDIFLQLLKKLCMA